jgi:integrase/recombinase XerD
MRLLPRQFAEIRDYLVYDRKFTDSKKNIGTLESRFRIMCRYFGERDFNRKNFLEFLRYLREKGYSTAYCNQFIKLAKHIDKMYVINELSDFTLFPEEQKVIDVLSPEQIIAMAEYNMPYTRERDERNIRNRVLIYTMFYTGARINEVLTLTWNDLQESPIPLIIFNQTKIKELRYAPIPESLYNDLTALPRYSGYIFCYKDGKPIDITTVNNELKLRAKAVGINKRVYSHLMRHSFINFMLRNGAKLHEVSRLVGHKSIATTDKYYIHMQIQEMNEVLHAYHPTLKKNQTLDSLTKKVKDMLGNILDTERFALRVKKDHNKVSFEVHELE